MRFRFVRVQKVRVNERYLIPMIIMIMGVKQWRGNQRDEHRDHTEACTKPLHIGDSYVRLTGSQPWCREG